MTRVPLISGAYMARSVIAAAQRSFNLYPEPTPTTSRGASTLGEPSTVADYPTPGLKLWAVMPEGPIRGIWQAVGSGQTFVVAGSGVYTILPPVLIGRITAGITTPVSMADNGLFLVIVDGTSNGWQVDLSTNTFSQISDPNGMFSGADRVDYLDTYLLFNKPGTPQFYISGSLAVDFDTLDFANKESFSDKLVTLAIAKRELWLFGDRTTEIWYNAGGATADAGAGSLGSFPFMEVQSVFIDHGICAKYSVATYDNGVFWLTRDRQGQGIVMHGQGYKTERISTYAIEAEIAGYPRIDDAIGFTYQLAGHTFYVLTFPHADKTWAFDITTGLPHEWGWIDSNGEEHRHRANCFANVNGQQVVGDWENGNLYLLDRDTFTDNGNPIKRVRSFPHILADGKRVFYRQFLADMETGTVPGMVTARPWTFLDCTFQAEGGTLLQDYDNPDDVGATWVSVSGTADIEDGLLVGSGSATYQAMGDLSAGVPDVADYVVQFSVHPPAYDSVLTGNSLWAIGRAVNSNSGYKVTVSADGTQYHVTLAALGTAYPVQTLAMGTIPSGVYNITLLMRANYIAVQVERTADNSWLSWDGLWLADPATQAFAIAESTWTLPGTVMIGGEWP